MLELIEIIGLVPTLKLIATKGGQHIYVPSKIDSNHWLAELLGMETAEKLCAHFSQTSLGYSRERLVSMGMRIRLPVVTRIRRYLLLEYACRKGLSLRETAALTDMTERSASLFRRERGQRTSARSNTQAVLDAIFDDIDLPALDVDPSQGPRLAFEGVLKGVGRLEEVAVASKVAGGRK